MTINLWSVSYSFKGHELDIYSHDFDKVIEKDVNFMDVFVRYKGAEYSGSVATLNFLVERFSSLGEAPRGEYFHSKHEYFHCKFLVFVSKITEIKLKKAIEEMILDDVLQEIFVISKTVPKS